MLCTEEEMASELEEVYVPLVEDEFYIAIQTYINYIAILKCDRIAGNFRGPRSNFHC